MTTTTGANWSSIATQRVSGDFSFHWCDINAFFTWQIDNFTKAGAKGSEAADAHLRSMHENECHSHVWYWLVVSWWMQKSSCLCCMWILFTGKACSVPLGTVVAPLNIYCESHAHCPGGCFPWHSNYINSVVFRSLFFWCYFTNRLTPFFFRKASVNVWKTYVFVWNDSHPKKTPDL